MGVTRIVVHVDRLHVAGISGAEGARLRSELQTELGRLLREPSAGHRLATLHDQAAIRVAGPTGGAAARPGVRLAQAVYKGLLR
jgi:hypothetical protein